MNFNLIFSIACSNSHVNGQVDKHRTGMLPFVFYDTFGYVYLNFSKL